MSSTSNYLSFNVSKFERNWLCRNCCTVNNKCFASKYYACDFFGSCYNNAQVMLRSDGLFESLLPAKALLNILER